MVKAVAKDFAHIIFITDKIKQTKKGPSFNFIFNSFHLSGHPVSTDPGRESQCGWRTKINWTKTAHSTRICTCICGRLGLVPINTHTHTHVVVWIRVEHWAYWRPQLVVAEKSVTPDSQQQQQYLRGLPQNEGGLARSCPP